MDLGFFKASRRQNGPLWRLDGRVKTLLFLLGVLVSALARHWYLAALLWLGATLAFAALRLPWRLLARRLALPFGIAWLVLLSLLFSGGGRPLCTVLHRPVLLVVHAGGVRLGVLIMLRIMAAVTCAAVLSFSTPMAEILETLRLCRLPGIMVDIAAMMFRYLFLLEETARNMRHAQASRTTRRLSPLEQVRNTGTVAAHVMGKALDRSIRVYQAMLARGYAEEEAAPTYFAGPVSGADLRAGVLLGLFPLLILTLNYCL